jgi:hypothetical protein
MSNRAHLRDPDGRRVRPIVSVPVRFGGHPVPVRVAERAATAERVAIGETTRGALREAPPKTGRIADVQIIAAGWNTSYTRYYGPAMLARDIPRVFPKGTLMMLDHATAEEADARPEGTLTRLAAVFDDTPYTLDGGQTMRVRARLYPTYRPFLAEAYADIGVSIRGGGLAEYGTADGRDGLIVTELTEGSSVDFVTHPGAGGRVLALLEAARKVPLRESRNLGAYLESRVHLNATALADDMYGQGYLTRPERIVLSNAIGAALTAWTATVVTGAPQLFERDLYEDPEGEPVETAVAEARIAEATSSDVTRALGEIVSAAYGGKDVYTWVRDYDAERRLVYFDVSDPTDCDTYQQAYATADDGALSLTGDRTEVVARTVYSPLDAPDDATVAESAPPPPAMPAPSTDGTPPAVPTPPKEVPVMGTESTGPAPGTAGQADGGAQATPVTEAALADATARAALAEAQRDEAVARSATLAEAAQAQARILAERDSAIAETRRLRADAVARGAVSAAISEAGNIPEALRSHIAPRVTDRIVGRVPLGENGDVNVQAMEASILSAIDAEATYAAALLEAQGAGQVRGLGAAAAVTELTEADFEKAQREFFLGIGMSEADATVAAKGR